MFLHIRQVTSVVLNPSGSDRVNTNERFEQDCFAAARLPDDHVYLAVLEGCIHVVEDSYAVLKRLYYIYSTNQFTFYLSINGW